MNATTGNPSRRHRKKAERFEAIFQTSIEMFAQQGFASVSIEAITEAVDISKGTFFNYFPSKDHVLVEYQRRIYDEMHEFAEGLDETSGRASFQQYFRKLARLIEREGDRYRMLHHILNARADLREQDGGRYERVFAHYHDFIERAVDSGELPTAIDRELFAEMMRDVWLGNLHQWVLRRSFKSLEQRFMQKLEILFSVSCA